MDRMIIKNVTVVLPEGILENRNVLVKQGKIADLDYKVQPSEACVDGQGNYLFAGFIDLHVHGGGGADFMDAEPESTGIIARARNLKKSDCVIVDLPSEPHHPYRFQEVLQAAVAPLLLL